MSNSTAVDPALLNATNAAPKTCPYCGALVTEAGADCGHETGAELLCKLAFLFRQNPARFCALVLRVMDRTASLESIGRETARLLNREQALSRQAVAVHCAHLARDFPDLELWLCPRRNGGR